MSELINNDNAVINSIINPSSNSGALFHMAKSMGLWSDSMHSSPAEKPTFIKDLSKLSPSQLSDLYGGWTYEFGRIVEICGVLNGQDGLLKIQLKSALASARARIRKSNVSDKSLTVSLLNDLAEEDPNVIDISNKLSNITIMLAQANSAKEIAAQFLASLSREISWRDAQIKAKIY